LTAGVATRVTGSFIYFACSIEDSLSHRRPSRATQGMTTPDADSPLPDDIESAHRLIRELLATLRQQAHLNQSLQHQLEQLLRRLYGKRSEKLDPDQLLLFAR